MRIAALLAASVLTMTSPLWSATPTPATRRQPPATAPNAVLDTAAIRAAAEAALPKRIDVPLQANTRWQRLPAPIQRVMVGPDNRVWAQMRPAAIGRSMHLDAVKSVIRREFAEKMPQIHGAQLLLLEPTGRAWFHFSGAVSGQPDAPSGALLLGFDGERFIERPVFDGGYSSFSGAAETRALYADKRFFYALGRTIYIHDGKEWQSSDFGPDRSQISLHLDADGKGIYVANSNAPHQLWRWRDGKWTTLDTSLPVPNPNFVDYDRASIQAVAPRPDGVYVLSRGNLVWLAEGTQAVTIENLIKGVQHESFEVREQATKDLIARGTEAEAEVRKAIAANQKEEVKYRFEFILANLRNAGARRTASSTTIGPYVVQNVDFARTMPNGLTLIAATTVTRADTGQPAVPRPQPTTLPDGRVVTTTYGSPNSAVVTIDAAGNVGLLPGGRIMAQLRGNSVSLPQAIVLVDNGTRAWLGAGGNTPVALLDFKTGEIVSHIGMTNLSQIMGALPTGQLFIAANRTGGAIYQFDPNAPETRITLKPTFTAQDLFLTGLGADGYVWGLQRGAGPDTLARSDGKTVERMQGKPVMDQIRIYGQGAALVQSGSGNQWHLVTPKETLSAPSLENLIEQNTKVISESFRRPQRRQIFNSSAILADAAGNIWVTRSNTRELRVYSNGRWLDAVDALMGAGNKAARVGDLYPIGNGQKVLASDRRGYGDDPVPSLLHINAEGKIEAAALPPFSRGGSTTFITTAEGIWYGAAPERLENAASAAVFVTEKGVTERIPGVLPLAVAANGDLICVRGSDYMDPIMLHVYRDGKLLPTTIALNELQQSTGFERLERIGDRLFGRVDLGLQEFLPGDAANPLRPGRIFNFDTGTRDVSSYYLMPSGLIAVLQLPHTVFYQLP